MVVVVLPSEPVMPMIGHGQTAKKSSISLVISEPFARLLKKTRVNARGTEDNVLIERIKVMRAENEVYAEGSEGSIAVAKLGGFFFVMHGNAHACSAQHTDERHIAHARADYADPFIRQAAEVLF